MSVADPLDFYSESLCFEFSCYKRLQTVNWKWMNILILRSKLIYTNACNRCHSNII